MFIGASAPRHDSYERLEFLGDRVLGLAVAHMVYDAFPNETEGELSRRLAALVRKETCAEVAEEWGVGRRCGSGRARRRPA
ncbi:MAG: ribonuclease III domain-containing protein [Methylocystis sp.]